MLTIVVQEGHSTTYALSAGGVRRIVIYLAELKVSWNAALGVEGRSEAFGALDALLVVGVVSVFGAPFNVSENALAENQEVPSLASNTDIVGIQLRTVGVRGVAYTRRAAIFEDVSSNALRASFSQISHLLLTILDPIVQDNLFLLLNKLRGNAGILFSDWVQYRHEVGLGIILTTSASLDGFVSNSEPKDLF